MNHPALARISDRQAPAQPRAITAVRPDDDGSSYRCPACDEMVDGRRMADVLEHHQHVLRPAIRPAWYEHSAASMHEAPERRGAEEPHPLRVLPDPDSGSAGARGRRYGH